MNTINITKKVSTITTWQIEKSNERIEYESDNATFYVWNKNNEITASIDLKDAFWTMQLCDLAVSNDKHEIQLGSKDYIQNTSFLSMVLTEYLHKNK
jgi:hypothetical protein